MTISTIAVASRVTPTVVKTYVSHYTNRKVRTEKPTAHISYDEGLNIVRAFLEFASHRTVEDLQAFTSQRVPHPRWVKVDNITIPAEKISDAAEEIIETFGNNGINKIGGRKWWQWRQDEGELRAEWIEMRGDYRARQKENKQCNRVMMYVHGGAYFFGSVDEHRYQMQRHARKLNARVLAPRYRLAPQYPFPCGLLDCLATYMYLITVQEPTEILLAGDSAGGGMVVALLCILRDRGLPLPAGAILISPWVDLTHSFPSLAGDAQFDYIPAHGFMQKPSISWPPPNYDEIEATTDRARPQLLHEERPPALTQQQRKYVEDGAIQVFALYHTQGGRDGQAQHNSDSAADTNELEKDSLSGCRIPGADHQLSIQIEGKMIVLKDQIQMYTTNQLISHPLVSPVLQPSLGGLPPLLIMTGGGELLRDEQIYLAHKAAHPDKYPLGDAYREEYDSADVILNKYEPTPVQLQVWDDLCHVAPTLSFTRPAKFMYRSVAQFGAWALARAQRTTIEIQDDSISIASSGSDTESTTNESTVDLKNVRKTKPSTYGKVGRAGDPIPPFKNHMIRQRVDRHGDIYPLAPVHEIPALQVPRDEIGVIKPGPVRKWMEAKKQWDAKYSRIRRKLQKQRIQDMTTGGSLGFAAGESPPPSALAGRRNIDGFKAVKKNKKSMGLAMWSMWGSRHDEHTIEREEKAEQPDRDLPEESNATSDDLSAQRVATTSGGTNQARPSTSRRRSSNKSSEITRSRSKKRTITVCDTGQTEGHGQDTEGENHSLPAIKGSAKAETLQDDSLLKPPFLSQYKNLPALQRSQSDFDPTSVTTGNVLLEVESLRNASTQAVFAAPGVLTDERRNHSNTQASTTPQPTTYDDDEEAVTPGMMGEVASIPRLETPASRRSIERLQSDQDPKHDNWMHLRSPSNAAVVESEGVVGEVDSKEDKTELAAASGDTHRPRMYDRKDTDFETAVEF